MIGRLFCCSCGSEMIERDKKGDHAQLFDCLLCDLTARVAEGMLPEFFSIKTIPKEERKLPPVYDPQGRAAPTGKVFAALKPKPSLIPDNKITRMPFSSRGEKFSDNDAANWEYWADHAEAVAESCDEIPDRGRSFAESVQKKLVSIAEGIRQFENVTEAQVTAIENMEGGVEKWLR